MKRILVCTLLALGTAGFAAAASKDPAAAASQDPAVVTGRVTDPSGAPIAGALVRIEALQVGTSSRADGRYRLAVPASRLRPGTGERYTVDASRAGYQRRSHTVTVAIGVTTTRYFVLAPSPAAVPAPREVAGVVNGAAQSVEVRSAPIGDVGTYELSAVEAPRQAQAPAPVPTRGEFNTENYAAIDESPFLAVRGNPLSTFSIDVDRASYSNVRRFLRMGQAPPKDAVRIEELLNYFPYAYPEPRGEHPFSVTAEVGPAPWNPSHRLVHVGLQGRHVDTRELPASNLVFLVDVSGSMMSPNKLPLVKDALRMLVDQLRPQDRVSLVVYAGNAGLVLDATPGDRKNEILEAIGRLEAGGSTAGGAGIRLAYQVAQRNFARGGNNRVVLATDGDFNVGASSDAEMFRLIEEKRREGTFLTVLGFGMGNLKDSRLEGLADRGNGNYAYIDDREEARKTLVSEFGGTLFTIAKDVKLQVEFNPARVQAYRLIGYENRALRNEEFDDDRRDAGDMGAGHSVTALYEIVPVGARMDVEVTTPSLRYQRTEPVTQGRGGSELAFVKLRYKQPSSETSRLFTQAVVDPGAGARRSDDFRFSAAVAGFGMLLRDSRWKGNATVDGMLELARGSLGEDRQGYRRDFVRLVERYGRIARHEPVGPMGEVADR